MIDLQSLKYADLRKLAKKAGVKANMKVRTMCVLNFTFINSLRPIIFLVNWALVSMRETLATTQNVSKYDLKESKYQD